jgi:hypothetical protein
MSEVKPNDTGAVPPASAGAGDGQVTNVAPTAIATAKPKTNPALLPKQQMTVGLLFGLVVLAVVIIVIIRPIISDIGQTQSDVAAAKEQLGQLNTKKRQLDTAQQNYQAVSGSLPIIDEAIPNYSDVPMVMSVLEKFASDIVAQEGGALLIQRMAIAQMPNDQPKAVSGVGEVSSTSNLSAEVLLTVTLTGDYQSIRDYIVKLRTLRHNFSVERLTFFAPTADSTFLDANVSLKYYYFE